MNQPPLIKKQRNTNLAICKAIAIILMCAGHAEGPTLLVTFIYLFHMPVFFIAAGYFFDKKYLSDPWTFVKKRFKGLYVPFVKWSLFFLIFHNLFFKIGLMNEHYGNWSGGVTHPYDWYQFCQRLVHIIFSMGGYDEFLAGAFWFFRALLLSSIVFLVLYLLLHNRHRWLNHDTVPAVIAVLAVGFAWFKVANHLSIVTVVQGGIRECWGVLFFALGVLYRRYEHRIREHWALTLVYAAILLVGASLGWQGMALKTELRTVATLPLTGTIGFLMVHHIASWLDRHEGIAKRFMVYCGNNTLYIYVFHIISFKIVSAIKIWYYGMDWGQIGCHMVIHENSTTDLFWVLYTIVGTAVPLLGITLYRNLKSRYHLSHQ